MTVKEFQTTQSGELKKFIDSPLGRELMNMLTATMPGYEFSPQDHLFSENRGAIRGYQLCLRNIIGLSMPPPITEEVKATYGVPDVKIEQKKD